MTDAITARLPLSILPPTGVSVGSPSFSGTPARTASAASRTSWIQSNVSAGAQQLASLQRTTDERRSDALQSAAAKLQTASKVLSGGGGDLADALGQLLYLQNEQLDRRVGVAKGQVADNLTRAQLRTKGELEAIRKRIEASKKSGFWGTVIKVLKVVAAVAMGVAGALSGNPLLIAGALLSIASMITAMAAPNSKTAGWIALGLGVAAMACSLGGGLSGAPNMGLPALGPVAQAAKVADFPGVQLGSQLVAGVAEGAAAGAQVPLAMAKRDELDAQADALQLRAWAKRLLQAAEDERELMKALMEMEDRGASLMAQAINGLSRNEAAAIAASAA